MDYRIRRIRPEDWPSLRDFRLLALATAPTAYGSTFAEEQAFADSVWQERASGPSSGCDRATFIAEHEGGWLAMATGLVSVDGRKLPMPQLVSMFVAAPARRQGVAVGLIEALVRWGCDCGADRLALWVTEGNDAAVALYQRSGFHATGRTQPLAHTPALTEQEMVRLIT